MHVLVIGESAVMRLGGIDVVINGPITKVGIMLMKSIPFSFA